MRRDRVAATLCTIIALLAVAGCGGTPTSNANANVGVCGGQVGNASARTANYVVVLVAGPPESASPSSASSPSASASPSSPPASASPSSAPASASAAPPGETVLSGALADVSGAGATHVELHICKRTTGAVVTDAHPAVTLRNVSTGAPAEAMPVAVMEGGEGLSDLHYGNNVVLEAGSAYAITVRIDSADTVSLDYAVPQAGATPRGSAAPDCMATHQNC